MDAYLDAAEDLVHHLDALVLVLHLFDLKLFGSVGHHAVDGDQQDHDAQAGKHRRACHKSKQPNKLRPDKPHKCNPIAFEKKGDED